MIEFMFRNLSWGAPSSYAASMHPLSNCPSGSEVQFLIQKAFLSFLPAFVYFCDFDPKDNISFRGLGNVRYA